MDFFSKLTSSAERAVHPSTVEIELTDAKTRPTVDVKDSDKSSTKTLPLYHDGEDVTGKVVVSVVPGKKLEHLGVKIELIGQVEVYSDKQNEFITMVRELAPAGILTGRNTFAFEFNNVEKSYESYYGISVRLRYFLRVTVKRSLLDQKKELELWVQNLNHHPENYVPIRQEVGIAEELHIDFTYNRDKYHLNDVIVGKVDFHKVRMKMKIMELSLIRRETTGAGNNVYNENETVAKFEIMDGAPVRGEVVPIRMYLSPLDLTPTYRHVNNKFSVKYFLNLVLLDEDDKRYFKQAEISLWRKEYKHNKSAGSSLSKPSSSSSAAADDTAAAAPSVSVGAE